jgi:hypothetical protein
MMISVTLVVFVVLTLSVVAWADSGGFHLLSAQFLKFDGSEFFTNATAAASPPAAPGTGGASYYTKAVYVPEEQNILLVNVSMVGDENPGNQIQLSCLVDGAACNPGTAFATFNAGWIAALNTGTASTTFEEDNGINYTWCAKIPGTGGDALHPESVLHNVQLRVASGDGSSVYLEGIHVFVYSANLSSSSRCTLGTP